MKYTRRPIEVEAVQLLWSTWGEMCDHAEVGPYMQAPATGVYLTGKGTATEHVPGETLDETQTLGLFIMLEGGQALLAEEGDWIIKHLPHGTLEPMHNAEFRREYESVEDILSSKP